MLTHNTRNRVIDEEAERVTCSYNGVDMEFNFNNFTETQPDAYQTSRKPVRESKTASTLTQNKYLALQSISLVIKILKVYKSIA